MTLMQFLHTAQSTLLAHCSIHTSCTLLNPQTRDKDDVVRSRALDLALQLPLPLLEASCTRGDLALMLGVGMQHLTGTAPSEDREGGGAPKGGGVQRHRPPADDEFAVAFHTFLRRLLTSSAISPKAEVSPQGVRQEGPAGCHSDALQFLAEAGINPKVLQKALLRLKQMEAHGDE